MIKNITKENLKSKIQRELGKVRKDTRYFTSQFPQRIDFPEGTFYCHVGMLGEPGFPTTSELKKSAQDIIRNENFIKLMDCIGGRTCILIDRKPNGTATCKIKIDYSVTV